MSGGAPATGEKIWTISEVTHTVKSVLERTLPPLWVTGEVGNLTIHRSGHVYLTLKDGRTQLAAVQFSGAAAARRIGLAEGMQIEAQGRISVYAARGSYQLLINEIRLRGVGDLQLQFEERKRRLHAEGLFDEARKKPLPVLPRCVGVVTSTDGAALRDFLQIIRRRYADMHVRIFPARVQGAGAAATVAAGVQYLDAHSLCDVIVITRGGGSLEDLWEFNDETLARAIAEARTPVISAVGHEVDFTICDFVSDLRVPTPSAAAELVVGGKDDLQERVSVLRRRLESALRLEVSRLRRRVDSAAQHYVFREPSNLVRQFQQRVDEMALRMNHCLQRAVDHRRERVSRAEHQLRLLNPHNVLTRGYSIMLDEAGHAVADAADVETGAQMRAVLAAGELQLTVTGKVTEDRQQ
jgi:exodeoxyribonuclease VII large subunit